MSKKLAQCPFCGEEKRLMFFSPEDGYKNISCCRCGGMMRGEYKGDAIAAWNRRASPASPAIVEAERVVIAAAERLRLTSTEEGCGNSDINILRRAVDALAALRQQDAAKENHGS